MKENIKFREIAEVLRQEFLKPEWIIGAKVCSESELMTKFSVSRVTAKAALQVLEDSGIIRCEQGKRSVLIRKPADESKQRCGLNFALICDDSMGYSNASDIPWLTVGMQRAFRRFHAVMAAFPFLRKSSPAALPLIRDLCDRNLADGFFLLPLPDRKNVMEYLDNRKIPYVLLNVIDQTKKRGDRLNEVSMGEMDAVSGFFEKRPYLKRIVLFGGKNDFIPKRTDYIFSACAKKYSLDYTVIHTENMKPAELQKQVLAIANSKDTCLAFSTDQICEINFILSGRKYKAETLAIKHYNPKIEEYERQYHFVLRPYQQFCDEAAKMMYRQCMDIPAGRRQKAIYLQSSITGEEE